MIKLISHFLLLALLIAAFGCRKKILRDVKTLDDIGIVHCNNDVLDEDELGIDCGGECAPCNQPQAPCTLNDNEIKSTNGFFIDTKSFNGDYSATIDPANGNYIYKAHTDATDYLELIFETKPDVSKTYKDNEIGAFDGIVSVIYYSNSSLDLHLHGELYVNHENGQYTFSSCDADFYNPWSGSSISSNQSFKVTFN